MSTQEVIEGMVHEIVTRFHPEKVILFGSQVRGDTTPDSDVDLLVVMPEGVNRRETAIEILTALSDSPLPKDVLVTTPQQIATRGHVIATVLHTALTEGKVLYAR
ncbi:MAG: nucleotidyltransferase domain-containing protein [Armatimonadota bacterium]